VQAESSTPLESDTLGSVSVPNRVKPPILSVQRVSRRFGAHEVLRAVDFMLEPGGRVALRGPNGSGKTTLLRCIAGTLEPSGGRIRVGEHEAGSVEARRLLGASLSQERSFYQRLSGHANLVFFARLRYAGKKSAAAAVDSIIEELEIREIAGERVDRCSTGMVQQLAFARALVGEPALLLLDEPTRSLDEDAVGRLWGALDRRRGTALVLATHSDPDLSRCDERLDLPL
jgi:ABC-type multidrug transport system ATPase subunit